MPDSGACVGDKTNYPRLRCMVMKSGENLESKDLRGLDPKTLRIRISLCIRIRF